MLRIQLGWPSFWALALNYVPQQPPDGIDTGADLMRAIGLPEQRFGDFAAGRRPRRKGAAVVLPEGA
jgi:hypothetical protein